MENIFAALSIFAKLDLAQAYTQFEVEEDSKKYLTTNTHKGLFEYKHLHLESPLLQIFFNFHFCASDYIDDIIVKLQEHLGEVVPALRCFEDG